MEKLTRNDIIRLKQSYIQSRNRSSDDISSEYRKKLKVEYPDVHRALKKLCKAERRLGRAERRLMHEIQNMPFTEHDEII
jgi:hypothetical protein